MFSWGAFVKNLKFSDTMIIILLTLVNVAILYPLKTPENHDFLVFSGGIK